MKKVRLGAVVAAVVAFAAAVAVIGQSDGGAAQAAPAVQPDTAAEIRIDLGGTVGQTTIEAKSISWGISNPVTVGSGGGGAGTGKATFSDINFIKSIDAVSPRLVQIAATGAHIPSATIDFVDGNDTYLRYTIEPVFVSSVQHSAGGKGRGAESVSLAYGAVQVTVP